MYWKRITIFSFTCVFTILLRLGLSESGQVTWKGDTTVVTETTYSEQRTESSRYKKRWSQWFNTDNPRTGTGDEETPSKIFLRLGQSVCPLSKRIASAECRVVGKDVNYIIPDILSQPCGVRGIVCLNENQIMKNCSDFEIRFKCDDTNNVVNPKTEDPTSQSGLIKFDVRIYVILAVVPVLVFIIRICWSFAFDRRRRRRNPSIPDEEAIDPSLSNPPPSYTDLFGVNEGPFILSRSYNLCQTCAASRCRLFSDRTTESDLVSGSDNTVSGSDNTVSSNTENANTVQTQAVSISTSDDTRSESDNVPTSVTGDSDTDNFSRNYSETNHSEGSDQCGCPCHKKSLTSVGYDNNAFENETVDGRPRRFLGLHVPVFRERTPRDPPPPTYQQALKILKKNERKGTRL